MNPLLAEFLSSLLRKGLTVVATYLVTTGVITSDQSERFIGGLILFLLSVGWSLWTTYGNRLKLVTALSASTTLTEHQVEAIAKRGDAPSTTTPKDVVPQPTPPTP